MLVCVSECIWVCDPTAGCSRDEENVSVCE